MNLRLSLARSAAWTLLVAGWVGLGRFGMVLAPDVISGFALVALWLLLLGAAASVGARDLPDAWARRVALFGCGALGIAGLLWAPTGGGVPALLLALMAWAALTALASGVVRSLRQLQPAAPKPPIGAAALGALCATVALGDLVDLPALALRLGLLLAGASALLAALQPPMPDSGAARRCRAGLFDCSLPAWPSGAWHEPSQWPLLLAGLVMLPMMATLPWMADWCRSAGLAPRALVALHLGAMFLPALWLRQRLPQWSARRLAAICTLCLAGGALWLLASAPPWSMLGLALAHGAAWGLAWAGQLWAPERRGRAGASPWRAAFGYGLLTLGFGLLVAAFGERGVVAAHAALGVGALGAWIIGPLLEPRIKPGAEPKRS